eukprot:1279302-Prorocentrum_lima.AAC.1
MCIRDRTNSLSPTRRSSPAGGRSSGSEGARDGRDGVVGPQGYEPESTTRGRASSHGEAQRQETAGDSRSPRHGASIDA